MYKTANKVHQCDWIPMLATGNSYWSAIQKISNSFLVNDSRAVKWEKHMSYMTYGQTKIYFGHIFPSDAKYV